MNVNALSFHRVTHIALFVHCNPEYIQCMWNVLFALRKTLVDILFGIEKWNVKPPDVAKRYIDEIEHAQFFHAAISVKHPCHTVGRWTGHLLSTSSHVCIDLRGFIAAPPPYHVCGSDCKCRISHSGIPPLFMTHSGCLFAAFLGHRWCCGWAWTQSVPFSSQSGSECSFAQLSFSMGLTAAQVCWQLDKHYQVS